MSYRIDVAKDVDMHEVMEILWRCFENPYQTVLRVFFPVLNNNREASLQAAVDSERREYKELYPKLIWLKVVDENTSEIVAGAKWYFYKRDSVALKSEESNGHDPLNEVAVWYPEGVGRDFATLVMHRLEKPRVTMSQKEHSYLNVLFTLPEHQRKGIGRAIMNWGLAKCDELGLECWLDASVYGFSLYQRYGFLTYGSNNVEVEMPQHYTEAQKAQWEEYKKTLLPIQQAVMWRPAGGKFVIGQTVTPWAKWD